MMPFITWLTFMLLITTAPAVFSLSLALTSILEDNRNNEKFDVDKGANVWSILNPNIVVVIFLISSTGIILMREAFGGGHLGFGYEVRIAAIFGVVFMMLTCNAYYRDKLGRYQYNILAAWCAIVIMLSHSAFLFLVCNGVFRSV